MPEPRVSAHVDESHFGARHPPPPYEHVSVPDVVPLAPPHTPVPLFLASVIVLFALVNVYVLEHDSYVSVSDDDTVIVTVPGACGVIVTVPLLIVADAMSAFELDTDNVPLPVRDAVKVPDAVG